jgi:hypothetical protein
LDRIGINLKIDMDFREQFQIKFRLDDDKFLQHYFPGTAFLLHSGNKTLLKSSIALQDELAAARKRLFGWT